MIGILPKLVEEMKAEKHMVPCSNTSYCREGLVLTRGFRGDRLEHCPVCNGDGELLCSDPECELCLEVEDALEAIKRG